MVNTPSPGGCNVMNWARPASKMPWSTMKGATVLSNRIAVPALVLWERPMGIPSFQNASPCQNSTPLAGSLSSTFPRWCSWSKMIWGRVSSNVTQAFTCLGLALLPLIPLTLRETSESVFSNISQPASGSRLADRSQGAGDKSEREFATFAPLFKILLSWD